MKSRVGERSRVQISPRRLVAGEVELPSKPRRHEAHCRDQQQLVRRAAELGVVLTVEQKPLQPLAMRYYKTTVAVRPVRT